MTLRARISATAGLAVGLAVLAAAVGLYLAVRSDLQGEIDQGLRQRAQAFMADAISPARRWARRAWSPSGAPGGSGSGAKDSPAGGPQGGRLRGGFPSRVQPAPFGAASGYVQFISPQGTVEVPGWAGDIAAGSR